MSLVGAALVSGGASLLGGIMGNSSAKKAAKAQMDFQERMSNTAHQREVVDLRKAGLNPILSAGGGGASVPSGAMPDLNKNILGEASNSALNAMRNNAEVENLKVSNDKIKMDTALSQAQIASAQQDAILKSASAKSVEANTQTTLANLPIKKLKGDFWNSISPVTQSALDDLSNTSAKGVQKFKEFLTPPPPPTYSKFEFPKYKH